MTRAVALVFVGLVVGAGGAYAGTEEQLATWVPGPLLAAALLGMVSLFIAAIIYAAKSLGKRLDKIEETGQANAVKLDALAAGQHVFATRDALGSLGDRFDERMATLREDYVALRERMAILEASVSRGRKVKA